MLIVPDNHFKYHPLLSIPRIFIDIDGTLSDFYRYFAQVNYYDMRSKKITISEIGPETYRNKAAIRKYIHRNIANKKIDYWSKIPMTKYGYDLWYGLKRFKPSVFTGVIQDDVSMEMGKIKWCRSKCHLGMRNSDLDRILINKNRPDYAMTGRTPNILIDDDSDNCQKWEEAGGVSYFFVDNGFVVEKILREVEADMTRLNSLDFLLTWNQELQRYCF